MFVLEMPMSNDRIPAWKLSSRKVKLSH